MKLFYPKMFGKFTCIGSECSDNCCRTSWDVEIDKKTCDFYKELDGEIGQKLSQRIYEEDGCYYMPHENGQCPFLNEKGLCSVQLKYGAEHISDICREHPRFYEWFGGYKEAGVGICCEEAVRLLFSEKEKITFSSENIDEEDDDLEFDETTFHAVKSARDFMLKLLQNRSMTIWDRLKLVLLLSENVQLCLDDENPVKIYDCVSQLDNEDYVSTLCVKLDELKSENVQAHVENLLNFFSELEFIDDKFRDFIIKARDNAKEIINTAEKFDDYFESRMYEYEHLAVYYVYRYYLKSVRDYDCVSKGKLAALCVMAIKLLDVYYYLVHGELGDLAQNNIVKNFSKEIEYSSENMELLASAAYSESAFSFEKLAGLLF